MNLFKKYLKHIWMESGQFNNLCLQNFVTAREAAVVLDIGPYDGTNTLKRFKNIKKPTIYAVDIDPQKVIVVKKLGIIAKKADAQKRLPFKNNYFDIVSANQIIEHLLDVDKFMSEIFRVLKPGGYLIIATENLSSWHNIFALILGWQAFSQHISKIKNIGNPFRLSSFENYDPHGMHIKIFTPRGLKELSLLHGFKVIKTFGAGYYPFPNPLSLFFSRIDPYHSGFIGIKAVKPNKQ